GRHRRARRSCGPGLCRLDHRCPDPCRRRRGSRRPGLRRHHHRPRGRALLLLGIDTSGAVSVAVARGGLPAGSEGAAGAEESAPAGAAVLEILAVRSDTRSRRHDEVLLALVEETLQAAGVTRDELSGVVVGRGPGPFTGLRVGLVSARSIAAVLGVPLHGLSSLDALAHQALAEVPAARGPVTVGVALDARRREVYHARYRRETDGAVTRIAEPAVHAPAEVAEELTACDLLVG